MKGQRGIPRLYHKTYRDRHGTTKQTGTWYADVWRAGRRTSVPLGGPSKTDATARLRELLGAIALGHTPGVLRLEDLLDFVRQDYRAQGYSTTARLECSIAHVHRLLGNPRASDVDTAALRDYQARRLEEGAARATVEVETCAVGRAFKLAKERGRVAALPTVPHLRLQNARQGFFTRADVDAIAVHLPGHWRVFLWAFYHTGWRPKELLSREWRHVDLAHGWLRLNRGETKNGDPRNTPIVPEFNALLTAHKALCEACERAVGCVVPWLFFDPRSGRRLRSYARPWHHACAAAGYGHRIMYDLRRTRVRSLERAGVSRIAAMQGWTGHRDYRSWQRYGISDEALLIESAAKVETFEAREAAQPATVQRLSAETK